MRVEPEQVLEQHRIAASSRIENTDVKRAFAEQQDQGYSQNWGREYQNERGGIMRPDKQRQTKPGHTGRPHAVHSDNEIQSRKNGRKAGHKDAESSRDYVCIREGRAEGRIKSPARVDSAGQHRVDCEAAADKEQIPAKQVDSWKGQVFRAD